MGISTKKFRGRILRILNGRIGSGRSDELIPIAFTVGEIKRKLERYFRCKFTYSMVSTSLNRMMKITYNKRGKERFLAKMKRGVQTLYYMEFRYKKF